ncbi:MAG: DUF2079 domain-containing protein, partial [Chloroflexota bacterium]|nr:DUF2079 domain-containing protein [Chloroflexota bacterium]
IIPHFYPGAQHNNFWYRYEVLGSSPSAAIGNLIIHPWLLFTTFITFDRFYYLASLIRSTGFLCLLAPEWLLLALPGLAENLLSTDPLLYSGVYHYNAAIIPYVMLAAIHGTRRLITCWQIWRGEHCENGPWSPQGYASMKRQALSTTISQAQNEAVPLLTPWQSLARSFSSAFKRLAAAINTRLSVGLDSMKRVLQRVQQNPASIRLITFIQARRTSLACMLSSKWQSFSERMEPLARGVPVLRLQWITFAWVLVMAILNLIVIAPTLNNFWADHFPGSREQNIQRLLSMIPADASISAGSNLNPHVSERQRLAVFPSISDASPDTPSTVQYIIVDLNAVFPEVRVPTDNEINHLIRSGQYIELARTEGVVLLVRRPT